MSKFREFLQIIFYALWIVVGAVSLIALSSAMQGVLKAPPSDQNQLGGPMPNPTQAAQQTQATQSQLQDAYKQGFQEAQRQMQQQAAQQQQGLPQGIPPLPNQQSASPSPAPTSGQYGPPQ